MFVNDLALLRTELIVYKGLNSPYRGLKDWILFLKDQILYTKNHVVCKGLNALYKGSNGVYESINDWVLLLLSKCFIKDRTLINESLSFVKDWQWNMVRKLLEMPDYCF